MPQHARPRPRRWGVERRLLVGRALRGWPVAILTPQLSHACWLAFTAHTPQVLAAAAPVTLTCLARFSSGMLADLLWSYAATGVRDEALLDGVVQVCVFLLVCFVAGM